LQVQFKKHAAIATAGLSCCVACGRSPLHFQTTLQANRRTSVELNLSWCYMGDEGIHTPHLLRMLWCWKMQVIDRLDIGYVIVLLLLLLLLLPISLA
jgi:hypothetical protein